MNSSCRIVVVIGNRRDVVQDLLQILLEKVLVGILLNLDQIGHFQHFFNAGKALADTSLAHIDVVYPDVLHDFSLFVLVADDTHECHHPKLVYLQRIYAATGNPL